MAEKEERILHIVKKLDGRFVGENRILAQEAIERMAKAFYAENVVRCNSDDCPPGNETCDGCPIWENCKHLAKIALNSLFEVQK